MKFRKSFIMIVFIVSLVSYSDANAETISIETASWPADLSAFVSNRTIDDS
ncbi:hypothetical protein CH379_018985 [Leptospira ellisii]|uniref:Uncharacterized protein n=1 Tax=Leptospira ellisii TaxID=2023197 RepID=A0AAE4QUB9_9LEPT|nr:hypothetical protein [Leptospira ellisii]MDV6237719.1 hypothetical protein [Leptospira ellisii]